MNPSSVPVVGLGASAGGLDAFHTFFEKMPAKSGFAFIVILHLPVARKSMLPDILGRWTSMPVIEATDDMLIEANCVYVPKPHAFVRMRDGRFQIRLPDLDAPREYRPIDAFFDSLAAALHEQAVGIVLSGTGNDGSLGLKAIKELGGTTFAQGTDGGGPVYYAGMPGGAIATGVVDYVLPVEDMPAHLLRLKDADTASAAAATSAEESEIIRLEICRILQTQLGHDFSGYREKTFMRRVQRRMLVLKLTVVADYIARLETDHDEVTLLFRDLLIRVTSFFRDAATFETLERVVMPRLFAGKSADGIIRVWVPGCATGEEAYSLAILLREYVDTLRAPPKIQIFATDIDEQAIAIARLGRYPTTLLDGLSDARRARFFHPSPSGYAVSKDIRDVCTFSPHSIVRDPPFSRMDLISCRNLLIYMDLEQQAEIIPAFHYALAPNGVLLLGRSETTARHEDLFQSIDKAARIFQKKNVPTEKLPLPGWERGQAMTRKNKDNNAQPAQNYAAGADKAPMKRGIDSNAGAVSRRLIARGPLKILGDAARHGLRLAGLYPVVNRTGTPDELSDTRTKLQSITEEHQTVVEELRSTNEELHSVNEELQSTNEELETSKEEIQSINEELQTVNARLSEKIDELDHNNSDLRNLFESTQIATIFLDRHLIVRSFTPAVATIYNLIPSDQGRPLTDIVHRLRYDNMREDVLNVLDRLQPLERRVSHKDGATHYLMRILPYRAPDSSVNGALATFLDVTSVVQAEQHQRLLIDELNHRVKNMLTVVISLATQTLKRSTSLDEFSASYMGRIHALTASYSLLASQNWLSVDLRDVLAEEMKPFAGRDQANVTLEGPQIQLAPPGALAMGMAIHELATNAVKYGALSVLDGSVSIVWRLEHHGSDAELILEWREINGPPVQQPARRGFGTTLIERGFGHELSGTASLDFRDDGLRATLRAPIKGGRLLGQSSGASLT